jgi:protein-export membrane protein SecD
MKINRKLLLSMLLVALSLSGCRMTAKSGTEYKVQIDVTEGDKDAIIERAIKITESRLNAVGIYGEAARDPTDPNVVIVKVYGSEDRERIKTFLFTSNQLELRKAVSPPNPNPLKTYTTADAAKQEASSEQEVFEYGETIGTSRQFVVVEKIVIVNGDDIRDATAVPASGGYRIAFSLKPAGAKKFGEWTGKNINNYLAVVLDKRVQSAAYIKSQIFDSGEISGRFSKAAAEDIALSLKSGYLPATMKVLEEKPFGN